MTQRGIVTPTRWAAIDIPAFFGTTLVPSRYGWFSLMSTVALRGSERSQLRGLFVFAQRVISGRNLNVNKLATWKVYHVLFIVSTSLLFSLF